MIAAYPRLLGPAEIVAVTGSHLQVSYLHQLCGGPVSFQSFQEGLKDQHGVTLLPFRASVYGQDLHAHPFLSDAASLSRTVSLGDTRLYWMDSPPSAPITEPVIDVEGGLSSH